MKFAAVTVVLAFAVECTARIGQYPYGTPAGHLFKKRHTPLEDEMTWSDKKQARDEKLFQILSRESGDRLFSDASLNEISEDINGDRRMLFAKRDMEYSQRRLKKRPCRTKNTSHCNGGTCKHVATTYCSGTICTQRNNLNCKNAGQCKLVANQKCTNHHCLNRHHITCTSGTCNTRTQTICD